MRHAQVMGCRWCPDLPSKKSVDVEDAGRRLAPKYNSAFKREQIEGDEVERIAA